MKDIFLIALMILACTSCDRLQPKNHADLKGQVFIVRRDRINVKLGGVELSYVPLSVWNEQRQWLATNVDTMRWLREYKRREAETRQWVGSLQSKFRSDQETSGLLRELDILAKRPRTSLDADAKVLALMGNEAIRLANANLFSQEFTSYDEQWCMSAIFFDWLERNRTATATTNADGVFNIRIPKHAPGMIFARASRAILGERDEHYFWIQKLEGDESSEILLSSNNRVNSASLVELLGQAAEARHSSLELVCKEFHLPPLEWRQEAEDAFYRLDEVDANISRLKSELDSIRREIENVKTKRKP